MSDERAAGAVVRPSAVAAGADAAGVPVGLVLRQDHRAGAVATGAGHHSVIHIPNTDDWIIVYHRRPLGETNGNHRETCMDRLVFNDDGTIQPVKITFEGVAKRLLKK